MKRCSRNRGIVPLILCHGTRWVVSIKPQLFYAPKRETQYQLNKLAVPQSQFRHCGEGNKLFLLPGIKPQTILYRVLYLGSLENSIPSKILTWLWVMPVYLRATIWVSFTSCISYIKHKCMYFTSLCIGTGMIWNQLYTSCSPGTRSRLLPRPGSTCKGNTWCCHDVMIQLLQNSLHLGLAWLQSQWFRKIRWYLVSYTCRTTIIRQ